MRMPAPGFEVTFGRELSRVRLEVSASQSKNDIEQNFTGIEYLDGRPPMSFYSSRQDVNHFDTVAVGRLHAGADYEVNGRTRLGAKLTYSLVDDITDTGVYSRHPMHEQNPDFTNRTTFDATHGWSLAVTLKRRLGR